MTADLKALRIDRGASRRPPRRSSWMPVVVLAVLAGGIFLFQRPLRALADRWRLPEVRTLSVEASLTSSATAALGKAANGYVVAARRAALSADTPGRIVEIRVTEGSTVKAGEVVARLYADEYEADLRRAEADLAAAQAEVAENERQRTTSAANVAEAEQRTTTARATLEAARPRLEWLEREVERSRGLFADRTLSEQELDRAITDAEAQRRQVGVLEAEAELAERSVESLRCRREELAAAAERLAARVTAQTAARDRARATLDKTYVRAPFDGIVVLKDAEVGEVVSPNSQGGSNGRGSVCTMVDRDSLEVQAEVPETSLSAVRLGGKVKVFLDADPDREHRGTVARIWPTANRQKATVEVRVRFDQVEDDFRPEMGVRVVFLPEGAEDTPAAPSSLTPRKIRLPDEALLREAGGAFVFVLQRDRVQRRAVVLGESGEGRTVVEQGLESGEIVVLDPPADLEDGDRVRTAAH